MPRELLLQSKKEPQFNGLGKPMNFIDFLAKVNADPSLSYALIRTVITYIFAVLTVRFGNKRFMFLTPFDVIFYIIIGSVLTGSILSRVTLMVALSTSFTLIFLHFIFAYGACKSRRIGKIIKGSCVTLFENGKFNNEAMNKSQITMEDINEEIHQQLQTNSLKNIEEIRLERTGKISFITKE